MDFEMNICYADNSLSINSEEMKQLQSCAAENNIVVCLGYSEKKGSSLYIGQCTIDSNGELVMSRRKLKPVHMERTLFGDGNGPSLNNVATTSVGSVGQLSCAVCTLHNILSYFIVHSYSNYQLLLIFFTLGPF
jgi:predicted amidohydrolase